MIFAFHNWLRIPLWKSVKWLKQFEHQKTILEEDKWWIGNDTSHCYVSTNLNVTSGTLLWGKVINLEMQGRALKNRELEVPGVWLKG
jgi:hypothetical protein